MKIFKINSLSDNELKLKLEQYNIGLTVDEARKIYTILKRDPTLTETVIWGNQGSEHASYKSTRNYLKTLPITGPNVILGPSEDSGIIKLCDLDSGDSYGIVVSHESHNSPSQIVPYEGAATGVGGIMRDIICMGSRAIGVLDSLRFGDLNKEKTKLIAKGCVDGISGYGNPIGVPNLGGDVYFDKHFDHNCLVNVFAIGLMKESQLIHSFAPKNAGDEKYDYILVGKATDNSGFGGAAFSSKKLDESKSEENKGAIQQPNPFLERHLMASSYDLFKSLESSGDLGRVGFKDLGAGGVICASVELVADQGFGAEVDLDKVHLGMENLDSEVIACSETQERFMWVCHPDLTQRILDHYNTKWELGNVSSGAKASHIGHVTNGGQYTMSHKGEVVCNAKAKDITEGLLYDRETSQPKRNFSEPQIKVDSPTQISLEPDSYKLNDLVLKLLGSSNISSSECIYEKYDKSVQANTIIERSESIASVIKPLNDENVPDKLKNIGVAVCQNGSGRYGLISALDQASNAVTKACLSVSITGATPQCITDCLNYGNPEIPEQMWDFAQGIEGIKNSCNLIKLKGTENPLPIVSGNVSMYKDVPPSAIIGCVGIIPNVKKAIDCKIKSNNSVLILVGKRKNELGGSEFYKLFKSPQDDLSTDKFGQILGKNVPKTDFVQMKNIIYTLSDLIEQSKIISSNLISEGGLIAGISRMLMPNQKNFKYEIGAEIDLSHSSLENYQELFSESLGVILEVSEENKLDVLKSFGCDAIVLGKTTSSADLIIKKDGEQLLNFSNDQLFETWNNGLRKKWN